MVIKRKKLIILALPLVIFIGFLVYKTYHKKAKTGFKLMTNEFFDSVNNYSYEEFSRNKVDKGLLLNAEPVLLQEFFKAIFEECGEFEGAENSNIQIKYVKDYTGDKYRISGSFRFARKNVPMNLDFTHGKLSGFDIKDQALFDKALKASLIMPPELEKKYADKCREFWEIAMGKNPKKPYQKH